MNLNKFARKIGFTPTELKVILFLAGAMFVGIVLRYIDYNKNINRKVFDYSKQDSLFNTYDSLKGKIINEKKVDSKQELLDFSKNESKIKNSSFQKSKIVNINTATAMELTALPGIGIKTAKKIIRKREELTRFTSKEDLLKVKGIGKKKFSKIRKFIIIK